MILIIDNYDSFTFNLYQYLGEIASDIHVVRNDKAAIREIKGWSPSHILISPGPGYPQQAGVSMEVIQALGQYTPILGVCLGHQAVGAAFGGRIVHARRPIHGKASQTKLFPSRLFDGLPDYIQAGRYHSLIVQREGMPSCLRITAETEEGEIMALEHHTLPVYGLQFHPESILTSYGKEILRNFIGIGRADAVGVENSNHSMIV